MESIKVKQLACVVLALYLLSLTGCANWQGAEFRIGIGSYNGATETKTYTKDIESKKY